MKRRAGQRTRRDVTAGHARAVPELGDWQRANNLAACGTSGRRDRSNTLEIHVRLRESPVVHGRDQTAKESVASTWHRGKRHAVEPGGVKQGGAEQGGAGRSDCEARPSLCTARRALRSALWGAAPTRSYRTGCVDLLDTREYGHLRHDGTTRNRQGRAGHACHNTTRTLVSQRLPLPNTQARSTRPFAHLQSPQ